MLKSNRNFSTYNSIVICYADLQLLNKLDYFIHASAYTTLYEGGLDLYYIYIYIRIFIIHRIAYTVVGTYYIRIPLVDS